MADGTLREELATYIRRRLVEGFESLEQLKESAIECVGDQHGVDQVRAIVDGMLAEAAAEHEREQAREAWPAITDCDRLDAAFEELNTLGIMARHHWTCCGNCGAAEMPDEYERLGGEWNGVPIIGYTFYHHQDTEAAARGRGVYLNYGSTEPAASEAEYNARSLTVGEKVRKVLEAHGLKVEWDGTIGYRIRVVVHWQRRARPARFVGE